MNSNANLESLLQAIKVEGKLIAFEYTLRLDGGEVVDSNVGQKPMVFQTGVGEMLPALEEALIDVCAGDSVQAILPPPQAYGPVTTKAHREFALEALPEQARQVGRKVMVAAQDGEDVLVEVIDITDDNTALLDFNHPLAGETLYFDIRLISTEELG
jgi:FKBP-type peptidyl-prolyl cis-trans isomerase SlyD